MPAVILAEEVAESLAKLRSRAEKNDGEARYLLKILEKGISKLAANSQAGKKIQKRLWPREYVQKFGVTNLWKINLDSYWRLIYTLRGDSAEIISFVLDYLDHRDYDQKFGYRTH